MNCNLYVARNLFTKFGLFLLVAKVLEKGFT